MSISVFNFAQIVIIFLKTLQKIIADFFITLIFLLY